jgi:hypothetical protein
MDISYDVEQLIMPNQSMYTSFIKENNLLLHPAYICHTSVSRTCCWKIDYIYQTAYISFIEEHDLLLHAAYVSHLDPVQTFPSWFIIS